MTVLDRIQSLSDSIALSGDYEYELLALQGIENDLPVYRHLGTPVWKIQQAKKEIAELREWIKEELEHRHTT